MSRPGVTADVLDNVVWHALAGPCRSLGEVLEHAARFDADVSPFAAVRDPSAPESSADLATIVGPGHAAVLFGTPSALPQGWTLEHRIPCVQMVADDVRPVADDRFTVLGPQDVPDMLELVAEARPGPFGTRTIEFGGYIGLRESGRLVAMAGQRLRCPGFTEISAVCTAETHRGRGLATALVLTLVGRIRKRGDEAMLHAEATNEGAIRLYRALGFVLRRELDAMIVRSPEER